MKFDLFDVIANIRYHFGGEFELIMSPYEYGIKIRIMVHNKSTMYSQFCISFNEANCDEFVNSSNEKFKRAINSLKEQIKHET